MLITTFLNAGHLSHDFSAIVYISKVLYGVEEVSEESDTHKDLCLAK